MRHAAFFVVLALAGCPHSKTDATPPRPATPKEVIAAGRATIEQWRQSLQVRSFEALAKLYAHEDDLVVVQDGLQLVGWTSVESMLKDQLEKHTKIVIRLKDMQVMSLGQTAATVTAAMSREIGDETTTVSENGTLTVVLRRDGDTWLIVTEHYSHRKVGS
jgi:ketosteroid isomerase-like protein